MGKMILVPCFDIYNDPPFPEKYTVKDHISNTKLAKGDHFYIQTRHKDLFPIKIPQSSSLRLIKGFRLFNFSKVPPGFE